MYGSISGRPVERERPAKEVLRALNWASEPCLDDVMKLEIAWFAKYLKSQVQPFSEWMRQSNRDLTTGKEYTE